MLQPGTLSPSRMPLPHRLSVGVGGSGGGVGAGTFDKCRKAGCKSLLGNTTYQLGRYICNMQVDSMGKGRQVDKQTDRQIDTLTD